MLERFEANAKEEGDLFLGEAERGHAKNARAVIIDR
jgi:hypothetical protein